jgi:iron complex outermembrane receptor protein
VDAEKQLYLNAFLQAAVAFAPAAAGIASTLTLEAFHPQVQMVIPEPQKVNSPFGTSGQFLTDLRRRRKMRKILLTLATAAAFVLAAGASWAQEAASDEFTLEEITVTAEKRASNLQELPSSVVALPGEDLVSQGKTTTAQILESVPNLKFIDGGEANPLGNISIRGIQRTQEAGGLQEVLPSSTAAYVDGVYQGIGGNYDVDRVEVLRGPQGTLYGRSATGGVVAFYTNNPELDKFAGDITAETGTASLINLQGAINVPVGEKVAFRAAGHYYSRDGYFDAEAGQTETKEGRIKVLYQPTEVFDIVLSGSLAETQSWGGGDSPILSDPDTIDYDGGTYSEPSEGAPHKYRQIALTANYDLGGSTLTYVGGFHDYDSSGIGAEAAAGEEGHFHVDVNDWPANDYFSHEARWTSDSDGPLSWLVGVNYFKNRYDQYISSSQTTFPEDPDLSAAEGYLVPKWERTMDGTFENYGIFTEETFELRDDFRITAGLRYDKTKIMQSVSMYQNTNQTAAGSYQYPIIPSGGELNDYTQKYDNLTYKLRFEYDPTPDSMLYFMTASGFLPGTAVLTSAGGGEFKIMILPEQELVSYELGSKNQFLDNRLRLNASLFYYDYEAYPEAININPGGGPPIFTEVAMDVDMMGLELYMEYLITMNDKVSFSAGYLKADITGLPDTVTWVPSAPPGMTADDPYDTSGSDAFLLDELPGNPEWTLTLDYDHTFSFGNGSTLVPRAEMVYTSGYNMYQLNYLQVSPYRDADEDLTAYNERDDLVLVHIGTTWTSPSQTLALTGYIRNVFDEEYKSDIDISNTRSASNVGVTPGDPRTWGLMVSYKF